MRKTIPLFLFFKTTAIFDMQILYIQMNRNFLKVISEKKKMFILR